MTDRQPRPYVLVGEMHDVVFAERTADLNLDLFARYCAGNGNAMNAADRNVDRRLYS
jgi:hypothetical protein